MRWNLCLFAVLATTTGLIARVDLSTLPANDRVQLTIYNSADLTLVRDARSLTLKEGLNQLQFSWANTLIDPTSLEMLPGDRSGSIEIAELIYPARVKNLGFWNVQSEIAARVPVEISYLTSGLSWRAFYTGTLTADESQMRLQGYVCVTNNSGEDYENAQTRLIVGKVNIIEQIASLAQRPYPYGSPLIIPSTTPLSTSGVVNKGLTEDRLYFKHVITTFDVLDEAKTIIKEGLSEYFLYTIDGAETIPNGWTRRLSSFDIDEIPVVNLYKFEEERYGSNVTRFLSFKNDEKHQLGETPIPGGDLKVYRNLDDKRHLSYQGQSSFKYIPVGEDVELDLGPVANVVVEPKLMKFATENYQFDDKGNIIGWDEIRQFKVDVRNTRNVTVKIEIKRNLGTPYWDLLNTGDYSDFEKEDMDTVTYTQVLKPQSKKQFGYLLRTSHGTRQEQRNQ